MVHDALENTKSSSVIISSLTPKTTVLASGDGADTITFLAPAITCCSACSFLRKRPVHSNTTSTPTSGQGNSCGLGQEYTGISVESTSIESPEQLM